MRAVVVDFQAPGGLIIHHVEKPIPLLNEVLVRVAATSINRGEVEGPRAAGMTSMRPGWDLAGTVEAAALDGSGPPAGTRVAGIVRAGAWAELVAVPATAVAVIPTAVSFAHAATLPVAGLTALHALSRGGLIVAKHVLITGATGGVGLFAVQIARASGACVVAMIRNPDHQAVVEDWGADHVLIGDIAAAAGLGPYHLALDAIGGATSSAMLAMLREDGTCISYGTSGTPGARAWVASLSDQPARTNPRRQGFSLFEVLHHEPAAEGITRLLALVASNVILPHVEVETSWTDIVAVATQLLDRTFVGKAILHL